MSSSKDDISLNPKGSAVMPTTDDAREKRKRIADAAKKSLAPPVVVHQPKTSQANLYFCIACFVVCGTFSTVLGKVLFQTTSIGIDGQEHKFAKPGFQNLGMFFGMTLCLVLFEATRCRTPATDEERLPLKTADASAVSASRLPTDWRVYYVVLVPAICDFLATYAMNIGLIWINASVWQMVRGSIIFFSAMIRWLWLKRKIHTFQWCGVAIVMAALCIIGYACIHAENSDALTSTESQKLLGVLLVFVAQLVQATQTVVEEHLLHDISASDMQIVGLEGFWGLLLCLTVALPLGSYLPYDGLHEDTWDTFVMLKNNPQLCVLVVIYCLVILGFNVFAMRVTMYINSVTRNILDTVRTMFIWIILTVVHYTVSDNYGEPWSSWSLVQLAGFVVLLSGLFIYYKVITLSCFEYPEDEAPVPVAPTLKAPMTPHSPSFSPSM